MPLLSLWKGYPWQEQSVAVVCQPPRLLHRVTGRWRVWLTQSPRGTLRWHAAGQDQGLAAHDSLCTGSRTRVEERQGRQSSLHARDNTSPSCLHLGAGAVTHSLCTASPSPDPPTTPPPLVSSPPGFPLRDFFSIQHGFLLLSRELSLVSLGQLLIGSYTRPLFSVSPLNPLNDFGALVIESVVVVAVVGGGCWCCGGGFCGWLVGLLCFALVCCGVVWCGLVWFGLVAVVGWMLLWLIGCCCGWLLLLSSLQTSLIFSKIQDCLFFHPLV